MKNKNKKYKIKKVYYRQKDVNFNLNNMIFKCIKEKNSKKLINKEENFLNIKLILEKDKLKSKNNS